MSTSLFFFLSMEPDRGRPGLGPCSAPPPLSLPPFFGHSNRIENPPLLPPLGIYQELCCPPRGRFPGGGKLEDHSPFPSFSGEKEKKKRSGVQVDSFLVVLERW